MNRCKNCDKPTDNPKFCDLSCSSKYNMNINKKKLPDELRNCIECSKEFSVRPWDKKKFCSMSCSAVFNNRKRLIPEKLCIYCNKPITKRINKYCNSECSSADRIKKLTELFLDGNLTQLPSSKTNYIYEYLFDRQSGVCQICSMEPVWNGKPLRFIRDHIDGNSSNNHPDNLRLICHNCDSQLDTYKAKNKGNGRHSRRQRYAEGKSY